MVTRVRIPLGTLSVSSNEKIAAISPPASDTAGATCYSSHLMLISEHGSCPEPAPERASIGVLDRRLREIAARQHGAVARRQAISLGFAPATVQRRLDSGTWERIDRHSFVIPGAPDTWHRTLMLAVLSWGPDAYASHLSAAALLRFPGFSKGPVELIVPRPRRRSAKGRVRRPVGGLTPDETTVIEAIPVTKPLRTLLDLAGIVPPGHLEELLDDALRRNLFPLTRAEQYLQARAHKGTDGVAALKKLIEARARTAVPDSVLETRLLQLIRRSGLPIPVVHHRVTEHGRFIAEVDLAYPDLKVAIEAEGYEWHSGRRRWQRDLSRRNRLVAAGWLVIHVTWEDLLVREEQVADAVRRALSSRRP